MKSKKEMVFDFGDKGDEFFMIMDGSVSVQIPHDIIHTLKPVVPDQSSKKIVKNLLD